MAVSLSHACTPRKSSVAPSPAASGTVHFVQCSPPSRVRNTVPSVPLAHATLLSTEKMPRRLAVEPDSCNCQSSGAALEPAGVTAGEEDCAAAATATSSSAFRPKALMARSICEISTRSCPLRRSRRQSWPRPHRPAAAHQAFCARHCFCAFLHRETRHRSRP